MLHYFRSLSWQTALPLFFIENLLVILFAVGFGYVLQQLFGKHILPGMTFDGVTRREILLASMTLVMNTLITHAGFLLWQAGVIQIGEEISLKVVLDFSVLFIGMDFLMYVFHYAIHKTVLHTYIHQLHHQYEAPQPIDLFVLHPIETAGFGSLWLLLIFVYPASFAAVSTYLALNVLFGVLGHSGVEPFPAAWAEAPILKYIGSSSFHFQHHQNGKYNFGFYTSLWDHLFGTYAQLPEEK